MRNGRVQARDGCGALSARTARLSITTVQRYGSAFFITAGTKVAPRNGRS